ncbi:MAG: hypothetical protein IKK43_02755 [Clostridia bacterium]|nr:hypothetical protein [Clostridia bacterium]
MKKNIIFLIAAIIVVIGLVGCNKKENDEVPNNNANNNIQEEVKEKPLNETYDLNSGITTIKDKLGETATELTEVEIMQRYNLGEIKGLEKTVITNVSENNHEEIAIVKLTSVEQQFPIQKMMYDRLQALKEEYKDNSEIYSTLENAENTKIKILDDVAVLVISKNANELIEAIDAEF